MMPLKPGKWVIGIDGREVRDSACENQIDALAICR